MTSLILPEPPSANRWWRMVVIKGSPRMLLSSEARKYKEDIAQLGNGRAIPTGPVRVSIDWYRGRKSGDLDKRIGILLDALQGVLFANDAQIVAIEARRHDDKDNPRVEVSAEPIDGKHWQVVPAETVAAIEQSKRKKKLAKRRRPIEPEQLQLAEEA